MTDPKRLQKRPGPSGFTVGDLVSALHEAQVGCYELAHWENTGEGDPDDHLDDANSLLASLVVIATAPSQDLDPS